MQIYGIGTGASSRGPSANLRDKKPKLQMIRVCTDLSKARMLAMRLRRDNS